MTCWKRGYHSPCTSSILMEPINSKEKPYQVSIFSQKTQIERRQQSIIHTPPVGRSSQVNQHTTVIFTYSYVSSVLAS